MHTFKKCNNLIQVHNSSLCFVRCNVAERESWISMWDEAEQTLGGRIDLLCNNAGVGPKAITHVLAQAPAKISLF